MDTQLTVKSVLHQSWVNMVQAQVQSGLTVRNWCAENNISTKTFYYRRKQIREEMLQAAAPAFVEVPVPVDQAGVSADSSESHRDEPVSPSLIIELRGARIIAAESTSGRLLKDAIGGILHA